MKGKVLKGPTVTHVAKKGLGEYFWQAAEEYGDRICQIDAYSYKEESFDTVRKRALSVAIQLRKMGIKPQDVVMIHSLNNMDTAVPVFAAMFLGACVCCTTYPSEVYNINLFIEQAKPKVIFVIESDINIIEEAVKSRENKPQICIIGKSQVYPQMHEMEKTKTQEEIDFKPVKVDADDTALILFSSGSTSLPKGVKISHKSSMYVVANFDESQIPLIDQPIIQVSSISWISAVWLFANCIIQVQPRIIGQDITTKKYLELVEKYKVHAAFIRVTNLHEFLSLDKEILEKHDISSMSGVLIGGNSVDPQSILKLRKIFPKSYIAQAYSSTEIGAPATDWLRADEISFKNKISSVGKPRPNMEIKIVDVETGELLGPHQEGEILVRSCYKMNGYCNKSSSEVFDEEDFLKTGDLGYYDEDDYLYIVDRIADSFKIRGRWITVTLVENILINHPAVKQAAVFAIPHLNGHNYLAACVVLKENFSATAKDIYDFVEKNMSDEYLLKGGVKFLNKLPEVLNGKVSRKEARKIFMSSD